MAPSPSAQQPAAKRGSLSARQWQDIRQAARLARSERVTLVVHNVKIFGDQPPAGNSQVGRGGVHDTGQAQQQQQRRQQPQPQPQQSAATAGAPATEDSVPMETEQATKRQQREARRREEHVPRRCVNRWLMFVQKTLWALRRQLLDATATAYFRAQLSPKQDAQRKLRDLLTRARTHAAQRRARLLHTCNVRRLRDLFWRGWTLRSCDPGQGWAKPLGLISARDSYIYNRAENISFQLQKLGIIASIPPGYFDGPAVNMDANTSNARHSGGRTATTRKVDDAGIPPTPGSARSRKKRSGRR